MTLLLSILLSFLISFFIILLAFTGLAVGILLGRTPIRGSCGGLSQWGWQCVCTEPCAKKRLHSNADQTAQSQPLSSIKT